MDKINRLISLLIPMSICNLRCDYCYLSHRENSYQNRQVIFKHPPSYIKKALSQKRLGGRAYINVCADGETLLAENIEEYIKALLEEGHYVEFVTNLTITSVLKKILALNSELLARLEFKCSLHYLELKRKNLLTTFAENVRHIWATGSSASIEIVPHDDLIPYIPELKEYSISIFGALPHVTIARDDTSLEKGYLTKLEIEEYDKIWSQFDSDFWKFKRSIFEKKITDFCYAGDKFLFVNMETGVANQCYRGNLKQNIFENIDEPIHFHPIGKCLQNHCYNGHFLLTLGCVEKFTNIRYGNIRDRLTNTGNSWLNPKFKSFLNTTVWD